MAKFNINNEDLAGLEGKVAIVTGNHIFTFQVPRLQHEHNHANTFV